ncbi:MAG: hypothetical protein WBD18_08260, partial [Phycisphaerae bacterium]
RKERLADRRSRVAGGIDVEAVGRVGGNAERIKEPAKGVGPEGRKRGLNESALATEAFGEGIGGEGVGEVAPPAARGEEFGAGALELLEDEDPGPSGAGAPGFGGGNGGEETRGARAHNDHVRNI